MTLNLNAQLTSREADIMEQHIMGHTKKEVAVIYFRSVHTINNTMRAIFRKTGARNIAELSVWYWCKRTGAAIDFTHPKRKIIPALMLALFLTVEFAPKHEFIRAPMTRARMEITRYKRNEDNEY